MQFVPVIGDKAWLGPWIREKAGGCSGVPCTTLGVSLGGELVAAALFRDYTPHNLWVDLRIDDPMASKLLFRLIGNYVVKQLGLTRLTLATESSNLASVRLQERLGAVREGVLLGAGHSGDDILISRLTPDCPLWRRLDGRRQSTPTTTRS